jgi:hypothetical protein
MGITQFEDEASDAKATGIYFQEQMKVFNCLSLVAGGPAILFPTMSMIHCKTCT